MKTNRVSKNVNPLVGQFFHSIENGDVKWQGLVLGNPESGWYLVRLFEWLTGSPTVNRLVKIEEMSQWLFYSNSEEMAFSYEHGCAWSAVRTGKTKLSTTHDPNH